MPVGRQGIALDRVMRFAGSSGASTAHTPPSAGIDVVVLHTAGRPGMLVLPAGLGRNPEVLGVGMWTSRWVACRGYGMLQIRSVRRGVSIVVGWTLRLEEAK